MRLQGRVAVVTGASRGVGRAVALALAREGADVVLAAKTVEPHPKLPGTLRSVQAEVEALGRRALPVQTDVREEEHILRLREETLRAFGRCDILVNNAGALWWQDVLDTPAKRFDLVMDVNVRAAFLCAQAFVPSMVERGYGHIINMSPPVDLSRLPGHVAYFISKYGMTMLTQGLAEELRGKHVAVHSLWPVTAVESEATRQWGLGSPQQWRKADILADAVLALVTHPPEERSGQAWLDEDVLRLEGVTDFTSYNCVEGGEPLRLDSLPKR